MSTGAAMRAGAGDAPGRHNPVRLTLALVAAGALLGSGFVSHAANRLVSGQPLPLWRATDGIVAAAIAALLCALALASFPAQTKALQRAVIGAAGGLLLLGAWAAGQAAAGLSVDAPPAARTLLGPGFWVLTLAAALAMVDALQRLGSGALARLFVAVAVAGMLFAMGAAGCFDRLSLLREYAAHRDSFAAALERHCALVLAALLPALLIGVPLGLLAVRRPAAGPPLFAALNLLQTIPSIALFGLLIAPLSVLATAVPALAAAGLRGVGFAPAAVALTLYSLLPVARNVQAGIAGVDPAVIEAARGMGLTRRQIFRRVELPLALPVLLAGLRIVLVQAIGLGVVAALIGAGGLGSFVFQGLGQYAVDLVLLGAVPVILLALAADFLMRLVIELARRRTP
jgi:osmoprotectant transport system permease protein